MMRFPITEKMDEAIKKAQMIAKKYFIGVVGTEHMLYGIASVDCFAGSILNEAGITPKALERMLEQNIVSALLGKLVDEDIDMSATVKQLLVVAHKMGQQQGRDIITTENMLFAIIQETSCVASRIIRDDKTIYNTVKNKLQDYIDDNIDEQEKSIAPQSRLPQEIVDLGLDLTQKARENKIDPIIGRSQEIERIIQILCRKTKNNPVLIGEPGVGKSAVVEGLARAIVEKKVPDILQDKIIFSLDLGSLMAGTKYRGQLEEKLKEAIAAIKSQKNIITFIDEIHTLAQAGSDKGEISPADMLKPYLSRGELQTIGATTLDEYRKYIEADKALERRFQPIMVEPPSVEETIEILRGLKENYEAFHKVTLTDEAIIAAVKLSDRYIADRFLPDKAIDLVDEAMSKAKVDNSNVPKEVKEKAEKIKELEIKQKMAVDNQEYEEAAKYRDEIKKLNEEIKESAFNFSREKEKMSTVITAENIATIVAKWTKIPVTKINEAEKERLIGLEQLLQARVVGQSKAVASIAKAIRRARAGLKDPNRPIGSFMFIGPTGVGKTELTKALSAAMFDDENNIIKLDMSEYMESHSISKLIGSPPGYIGHDDGGQLTEQVRRKPYSVVLFDEIEKAHPDIYNSLLQLMDEGRLTDSQGRTVSFKNTIIILTSNVGVDELKNSPRTLGFGVNYSTVDSKKTEEILQNAIKKRFKPEFLNRIDSIIMFEHLNKDDVKEIANIMLKKVQNKLNDKDIKLKVSNNAIEWLVKKGYDPEYGARPLRRLIEQTIEDSIAEELLTGNIKDGQTIAIDIDSNGKVVFE